MDAFDEIAIEWTRKDKVATITAYNGSKLKNKIMKLAETNPEVDVVVTNTDGSIVAHVPVRYIKISAPRKISDEQKEQARQRMLKMQR